jgi:hypothetical protein
MNCVIEIPFAACLDVIWVTRNHEGAVEIHYQTDNLRMEKLSVGHPQNVTLKNLIDGVACFPGINIHDASSYPDGVRIASIEYRCPSAVYCYSYPMEQNGLPMLQVAIVPTVHILSSEFVFSHF